MSALYGTSQFLAGSSPNARARNAAGTAEPDRQRHGAARSKNCREAAVEGTRGGCGPRPERKGEPDVRELHGMSSPQEVLDFWFGREGEEGYGEFREAWFN